MFDPQKAEPVFLEIVKRLPEDAVRALGETIRHLLALDFAGARRAIDAGRGQFQTNDPAQKVLSALQVNVSAHERLKALGHPPAVDRIWSRAVPADGAMARETVVSHETQKSMLDEVRSQLTHSNARVSSCPICGSTEHARVGRAPLVRLDEAGVSHEQRCRAIQRYLDPAPLLGILRTDIANTSVDRDTTLRILLSVAVRDRLSVPVARCRACTLAFVALTPRPVDDDADAGADAPWVTGPATTFLSAYEQGLLAHWIPDRAALGAGARVFEFGCGAGTALAHHAAAGMRVSGYDDDGARISYARDILGLAEVTGAWPPPAAAEAGSTNCVVADHALSRFGDTVDYLDTLSAMVTDGGCLVVVAPNGELARSTDSVAGGEFPMLGGRQRVALTPAFLKQALEARGFSVEAMHRGPGRLDDRGFDPSLRDPLTGVPLWSARSGDFVILARRRKRA